MKNLNELHSGPKEVSAQAFFKGELGSTVSIQLMAGANLKEHSSKTKALLLCVSGKVSYTESEALEVTLSSGDYVLIEPEVKHAVLAHEHSQLLLLK